MPHISLAAETLFTVFGMPVTNALFVGLLTAGILILLGFTVRRKLSLVPGMFQAFVESAAESLLGLMDSVFGSRKKSETYFPLIATIFLFILVSNWLGLLPGVGSLGVETSVFHAGELEHEFLPFFRAPAADLNFTIMLAVVAVLSVNILGTTTIGFFKYFSRFFTFKNPIFTFAGLLEFISEFVKIISFSFRLFGNIFAGEVLLTVIGFLVPFVLPVPFLFLEIFVGFIQAFIFAMLTLVFIAMAVTEEH